MTPHNSIIIRILRYQFLVICVVSLTVTLLLDLISGTFAFLGGLIAFLPNAYFGFRITQTAKLEAKKFINSF